MDSELQGRLTVAQIDQLLAGFRGLLLGNPVEEIYIQVVIRDAGGGVSVLCNSSGSHRYRRQMLDTLHDYLRRKMS